MKKRLKNLHWDWWIVLIFLIISLVMNFNLTALSIFFAIIYAVFILMLFFGTPFFIVSLVMFLTMNSATNAYLFANGNLNSFIFYTLMGINLIIIGLLIQNYHKEFEK